MRWLGVGRSVPGHMALFVAILDAGLGRRGCALGCQAVPMGGQLANVLGVWLGWRGAVAAAQSARLARLTAPACPGR